MQTTSKIFAKIRAARAAQIIYNFLTNDIIVLLRCCCRRRRCFLSSLITLTDLIHDGTHVEFAIIMELHTSQEASNTRLKDYNEHFGYTDDFFHVH